MGSMRTRNLIAAIILLAICAGYGYLTANLPSRAIENSTQPSFFPWIVTIILSVLSLSLLVQAFLPMADNGATEKSKIPPRRGLIGLVIFVVYLVALPYAGFVIANIPLFAALMMLYGERRPVWITGGSTIISLAIFFLFREIFQIRLPAGILDGII